MEALILTYSYWIILPLAIVEGPIVTVTASFLASLGYLNPYMIYALALAGDTIGDALHFAAGRYGGKALIDRFDKRFGIDKVRIESYLDQYTKDPASFWKVVTVSKILHAPSSMVMLASGMSRVRFGLFFVVTGVNNIFKVLAFVCVGYFAGDTYIAASRYTDHAGLAMILACVFLAYVLYRRK